MGTETEGDGNLLKVYHKCALDLWFDQSSRGLLKIVRFTFETLSLV